MFALEDEKERTGEVVKDGLRNLEVKVLVVLRVLKDRRGVVAERSNIAKENRNGGVAMRVAVAEGYLLTAGGGAKLLCNFQGQPCVTRITECSRMRGDGKLKPAWPADRKDERGQPGVPRLDGMTILTGCM